MLTTIKYYHQVSSLSLEAFKKINTHSTTIAVQHDIKDILREREREWEKERGEKYFSILRDEKVSSTRERKKFSSFFASAENLFDVKLNLWQFLLLLVLEL